MKINEKILSKLKLNRFSIRGILIFSFLYLVGAKEFFSYLLNPKTAVFYVLYIIFFPIAIYVYLWLVQKFVSMLGLEGFEKVKLYKSKKMKSNQVKKQR